jgi:hypothetical protein
MASERNVNDASRIDAHDAWAVVKASATNRLGVPLLKLWAGLIIASAVIVAASVAWMYLQ